MKKILKSLQTDPACPRRLLIDLSCAPARYTALRFVEQQVDVLLSIPRDQMSDEEWNNDLQIIAQNIRTLEKEAAQELKRTTRALAKRIKKARGEFGNEIRVFRKIRRTLERKLVPQTAETPTDKPAGETP